MNEDNTVEVRVSRGNKPTTEFLTRISSLAPSYRYSNELRASSNLSTRLDFTPANSAIGFFAAIQIRCRLALQGPLWGPHISWGQEQET